MSREVWEAVDSFYVEHLTPKDAALDEALAASDAAGLPSIQVSALQGKQLNLLARMHGSKSILEIGTLGGYSTIWMARALPNGGKLVSLELDQKHAEVARENVKRAGLADKVEIHIGPALESLPTLQGPFDFIFIDADKANIPSYFEHALRLSRSGSIIIVDNVVRSGAVTDPATTDESIQGVRRFAEMARDEPRVEGTVVQTVGMKGYDGFAMLLVK